ncbi:hypothetical protein [Streptomyces sp. NBC_01750]|uniref:hypothetical protein n=1 Tax=Streptomyces sp. NBC_01750 TaxID=2975928 RepID=UPI002DD7AB07|nr:hypothetical protein [Streptomyces sp. NBC_01750]WSD31512.1 hypothetical protein OG966_06010 [Streptomyces sp. NBC_01750]
MNTRTTVAVAAVLFISLAGCGTAESKTPGEAETPTVGAASTPSLSAVDQLRNWRDTGGSDQLSTITADLTAVNKDSHPVNLPGLRKSCPRMTADLEAAQKGDPMPDKTLATRWSLALEHLAASAAACAQGANSEDQASFDTMAAEMSIGTEHLVAVNDRLTEIIGS